MEILQSHRRMMARALRYVIDVVPSGDYPNEWDDIVRTGSYLTQLMGSVDGKHFMRYDTRLKEWVPSPFIWFWKTVEAGSVVSSDVLHAQIMAMAERAAIRREQGDALLTALQEIKQETPHPDDFKWILGNLGEEYTRQTLTSGMWEAIDLIRTSPHDALDLLGETVLGLQFANNHGDAIKNLDTLADEQWHEYEAAKHVKGAVGLETGFLSFDSTYGGLRDGEVLVIGARQKTGKSWLALHAARHCYRQGGVVLLQSAEMSTFDNALRLAAMDIGADTRRIFGGSLGEEMESRYLNVLDTWKSGAGQMYMTDRTGLHSVQQLRTVVRQIEIREGRPVSLIVVDPLYKLTSTVDTKDPYEWTQVAQMVSGLVDFAQETGSKIITTHQLNRASEQMSNPGLEALKYSDAIGDEVHHVWIVRKEADQRFLRVRVAAARQGPMDYVFRLMCDFSQGMISDVGLVMGGEHGDQSAAAG